MTNPNTLRERLYRCARRGVTCYIKMTTRKCIVRPRIGVVVRALVYRCWAGQSAIRARRVAGVSTTQYIALEPNQPNYSVQRESNAVQLLSGSGR